MAASSDGVIVENCFGRLCCNWNIQSTKFKWAEQNYGDILKLCLAMTNSRIRFHPLREADGIFCRQALNCISHISRDASEKRRRTQERYCERRRRHLGAVRRSSFDTQHESDEDNFKL